ncbi:MAG TPA: hypothetical protein VIJ59_02890 [Caulobacteraceae bacterium]
MSDQPPPSNTGQRIVGILLMAAGALVATLCGLCSLAVVGGNQVFSPNAAGLDAMVAVIGGVPTVAGVVTFFAGLMVWRHKPK